MVSHKGCTKISDTVNVFQNLSSPVIYSNNGISAICNSSPITLSVSPVSNTNYQWSTGATSQSITASSVGTYYVTATNSNCTATAVSGPFTVISDSLSASFTTTGVTYNPCTLVPNGGSITTTVNGNATGDSFCWHDNSPQTIPPSCNYTTQNLNNLESGTYYVTITDNLGCSFSSSVNVPDGFLPELSQQLRTTITTNGCNATATVSGGLKPYTYVLKWKCINSNTETIINSTTTNLSSYIFNIYSQICRNGSGYYTLELTDACGSTTVTNNISPCRSYDESEENQGYSYNENSRGISIYPNPNSGSFKILGIEKADIEIYDLNGKLLVLKNNITEETEINIEHLSNGLYYLRFIDNNVTMLKIIVNK